MIDTTDSATAIARIIQLAVAPVFLLAGVGAFLNVCASRLARIVDRGRALEPLILASRGDEHDRLIRELRVVDRRMRLVSTAITATAKSAMFASRSCGASAAISTATTACAPIPAAHARLSTEHIRRNSGIPQTPSGALARAYGSTKGLPTSTVTTTTSANPAVEIAADQSDRDSRPSGPKSSATAVYAAKNTAPPRCRTLTISPLRRARLIWSRVRSSAMPPPAPLPLREPPRPTSWPLRSRLRSTASVRPSSARLIPVHPVLSR